MKLTSIALLVLMPLAASAGAEKGKTAGNPSAPITIELYSDFQCPNCKALHDQVMPQLMQQFVATGKVYLIEHDFPLTIHAHSRTAANYATAAAQIGKYQAVTDALFRDQAGWAATGKVWESVATALTPAEQKKVEALVKDPAVLAEVQKDVDLANANHINQTPTMIVKKGAKSYPVAGMIPYNILKSFLDDQLKK